MAMRKYQTVEKADVLPPKEQQAISNSLHKLGKSSARDLTDEERKAALDANRV